MDHLSLTTSTTFAADDVFVLTRAELDKRRPPQLHKQDFYELFWVQNGTVRLHTPDGHQDLTEGDLVFIGPDQLHGLQGRGETAIVVALAIRPGLIRALGSRHDDLIGIAFWADTDSPAIAHLDIRQLASLNAAALQLDRSARRKLDLEALLLPLLVNLDAAPAGLSEQAPDWLKAACAAAQNPQVYREGAAGFVAACGRAHPHVSRSMRRYMNTTPSEFINAIRMTHAARQLTGTSDPISGIAEGCGLPNLSHFHKLFLAAHGETPQRYRKARQSDLIQPRL